LDNLKELNEIAAAENDLIEIPTIENKNELRVFDLSFNKIAKIDNLS